MKTTTEIARGRIEKIQQRYLNQLTFGSWNNGIYWFMEIVMILFALAFIILALLIPSDPLSYSEQINSSTSVRSTVHNDDVTVGMYLVKAFVFLAAIGFLFAAVLCSKVRKRSNLLMNIKSDLHEVYDDLRE